MDNWDTLCCYELILVEKNNDTKT